MCAQVFIAHSTRDAMWRERLTTMLAPLQQAGLSCWDETQIEPGQHRQEQIAAALGAASVAVLLVSPDFLASEFVLSQDVSMLLDAAHQEKRLKILRVAVRPCLWPQSALAVYQPVQDPARPLSTLSDSDAEAALVAICQHIQAAVVSVPSPLVGVARSNPYRGLSAFQVDESHLFFGREGLIEKIWTRFKALHNSSAAPWFLGILGPSGSGKSSVARAGLLAELKKRPVPGPHAVRTMAIRPGEHPVRALALALCPPASEQAPDLGAQRKLIADLIQPSERGAFDGLTLWAANMPAGVASPLVVLVDQFEEVYTLCRDKLERDAFVGLLLHAASDRARQVAVVITLRSDFLGETHRLHPELNWLLAEQVVIVSAMRREELRQVIVEPANQAGWPLEAATVELLLTEAWGGEGALPLLEFALTQIWEGLSKGESPGAALHKIGGVGGALASRAQAIYGALSPPEQATVRRALVRLVQLGEGTRDTRRRAPIGELCGRGEQEFHVLGILRQFAAETSRLVTLSSNGAETVAEVTHEALFDHWKELRTWIDEGRADRRFHDRVAEAARLWNEDRSRSGRLWRPPDLDLLRVYAARKPEDLSTQDEAFFSAAQRAQQAELEEKQQRALLLQRGLVLVSLLLVISIVIAVYALKQRDQAEQRELDIVVENGRQLLVEKASPIEALLRLQRAKERGSRSTILPYLLADAARPLDAVLLVLQGHLGAVASASYSPDGRRIVTGSWDKTARVWDAQTGRLVTILQGHSGYVESVGYSPDGRRIITGSEDKTARVWDAQTGQLVTILQGALWLYLQRELQPRWAPHCYRQRGQDGAGLGRSDRPVSHHLAGALGLYLQRELQPRWTPHRHRQRGQDSAGLGRPDRPVGHHLARGHGRGRKR